jgi:hypothetical protein
MPCTTCPDFIYSNVSPGPYYLPQGATAYFSTTFYDQTCDVDDPTTGTVNITYFANGVLTTIQITMTNPTAPSNLYTAAWNSNGVDFNTWVWWTIVSSGPPFSVENGQFFLLGNNATQGAIIPPAPSYPQNPNVFPPSIFVITAC